MLLEPLMEKYDSIVLTEKTDYYSKLTYKKHYLLRQVNRKEKLFIFSLIFNALKSLFIYMKEKPNVIICTGVLAMIPMCLLVKLFGGKLIYIESFAKITSPTKTGSFLYKYADRFYVQWESMLEFFPDAVFIGGIY